MSSTVLHYIYDPLCGWCYGAAPLVKAARTQLRVLAHGGGMMAGAHSQRVSKQLRDYVLQHDRRIAELTGQIFGEGYMNGLLLNTEALLDSEPPITAILAADKVAEKGLDMLATLQIAHYGQGLQISDPNVLLYLADEMGLDTASFVVAFNALSGESTQRHIKGTLSLMAKYGVSGFPGFVLESDDTWTLLNISSYLGKPEAFAAELRNMLPTDEATAFAADFSCGADSCSI